MDAERLVGIVGEDRARLSIVRLKNVDPIIHRFHSHTTSELVNYIQGW